MSSSKDSTACVECSSNEGVAPGPASPRFIILDSRGQELGADAAPEEAMRKMRRTSGACEVRSISGTLIGRRVSRNDGLPKITSDVYATPSVWFGARSTAS